MKTIAFNIIRGIKKLVYLASPEGELVSYPAKNNKAAEKRQQHPNRNQRDSRMLKKIKK